MAVYRPATDETPGAAEPVHLAEAVARARRAWRLLGMRLLSVTPRGLARFLLVLLVLYLLFRLARASWGVLVPFQVGAVLAYLLLPLVNRLTQAGAPRWLAVLAVLFGGLLIGIATLATIIPALANQIIQVAATLPEPDQVADYMADLQRFRLTLPEAVQRFITDALRQATTTGRANVAGYVEGLVNFLVTSVLGVASSIAFLLGFLVIPFWLFYVLNDQERGTRAMDRLLPRWMRDDFWAVLHIFDRTFSGYLRGQFILGVIVGIASFIGLTVIELLGFGPIPFKVLLAVLAGITELIPGIGPILGMIPAVIAGLFISWQSGVAIVILYIIIQQLENNFLVPRIIGHSVGIHPAVLMVLLIGFSRFGLIWVILAAPLAAVARDLFIYAYGRLGEPPTPAGIIPEGAEAVPPVPDSGSAAVTDETPTGSSNPA